MIDVGPNKHQSEQNQKNIKRKIEQLRFISQLMDAQFKGPFGFRFGLDGLIGLIPGIGDLVTTIISLYIIAGAYQLGVGPAVIARMFFNQGIDSLIGLIPFFGDLFDIGWKSNLRNMTLLDQYMLNPKQTKRRSWGLLIGLIVGVFLILFFVTAGIIMLFKALASSN